MSLTSQEFESCCSKLVETPSQSALLKMTWFVDSLSVSSYDYQEFFLTRETQVGEIVMGIFQ